jgi:hypothetical protein
MGRVAVPTKQFVERPAVALFEALDQFRIALGRFVYGAGLPFRFTHLDGPSESLFSRIPGAVM